jgi:hypothetical protein
MWAVDDPAITRLLLERGADPNVRSADRRTALDMAVARYGASDVVRALLDRGAMPDQNVMVRAADSGDGAILRLLAERGARAGALPPDLAMRSNCADCVDWFVTSADRPALNRALALAAGYGDSNGVRKLLTHGAEPSGAALTAAASSELVPLDIVNTLLGLGARDAGALDSARRLGETPVVAALRKVGGTESTLSLPDLKKPPMMRSARAAIEASLPLLQHADSVFLKTAGCISCHNNSLFQMTAAIVRSRGFRIDEQAFQDQMQRSRAYLESWRERELQDVAIPGRIDTTAYILVGLAAAKYPADAGTDALARYVRRRQYGDGGWRIGSNRPPIESSDFAATALSIRALQQFAPPTKKAEYVAAARRGAAWLAQARPVTTEDHVYQVLGLGWGQRKDALRKAARSLIALQRADGGWGQLPSLASDAYATGQALSVLTDAGALAVSDRVYQKGVRFLLGSQLEDGSWYVRTRADAIQPYFNSEFPHGKDQFISAAATNWATMALASTIR